MLQENDQEPVSSSDAVAVPVILEQKHVEQSTASSQSAMPAGLRRVQAPITKPHNPQASSSMNPYCGRCDRPIV